MLQHKLPGVYPFKQNCYKQKVKHFCLGIMNMGLNVRDQVQIRFSAIVRYRRKNGSKIRQ
jgi:hypothetical protein